MKELVLKIMDASTLNELKEVGRVIFEMEESPEKRLITRVYKERKQMIIDQMKMEDSLFSDIYWLIATAHVKNISRLGRLLYKLKDTNLLSKEEINVLFDIYERKKKKLEETINENVNEAENVEAID
ncbi:MAG: hypothetical protein QXX12_02945 [Nanopusillaceae archaeon]